MLEKRYSCAVERGPEVRSQMHITILALHSLYNVKLPIPCVTQICTGSICFGVDVAVWIMLTDIMLYYPVKLQGIRPPAFLLLRIFRIRETRLKGSLAEKKTLRIESTLALTAGCFQKSASHFQLGKVLWRTGDLMKVTPTNQPTELETSALVIDIKHNAGSITFTKCIS